MAFVFQIEWGWMKGKRFRTKSPVGTTAGHHKDGGVALLPGTVVRCTMVSGMGDVGVTTNLKAEGGYNHRAFPHELERLEDETYTFEFDPDTNPHFQNAMFREVYGEDIVPWTADVLDPNWWSQA